MNKLLLLLTLILTSTYYSLAQCNVKNSAQNQGVQTYYIDPELVAQTNEMGVAMSVQVIGESYYLAITYQFRSQAEPVEEKVAIELKNGYTLELEMYNMEVANAAGVELCLAVFFLTEDVMPYFVKSPLKAIHFNTLKGKKHDIPVTSNQDVLMFQLKCFGK